MGDYVSISMPKSLVKDVEIFINKNGRYRSITDFIVEATRTRLEELEK